MGKDAGGDSASPYGTRSRNRNGSSRPNYAEDKDIDADVYDYYQDKKDGDSKKSSRQASAAANGDAPPRGGAISRKAGTDDTRGVQSQNGPKDQNSSGSNAATPTAQTPTVSQPSRKRKAAAQSAGSTGQVASASTSSKKAGTTAAAAAAAAAASSTGISWPETNMLTFENCKARPDRRRMVADDGTVLEPNGNAREVHRKLNHRTG